MRAARAVPRRAARGGGRHAGGAGGRRRQARVSVWGLGRRASHGAGTAGRPRHSAMGSGKGEWGHRARHTCGAGGATQRQGRAAPFRSFLHRVAQLGQASPVHRGGPTLPHGRSAPAFSPPPWRRPEPAGTRRSCPTHESGLGPPCACLTSARALRCWPPGTQAPGAHCDERPGPPAAGGRPAARQGAAGLQT